MADLRNLVDQKHLDLVAFAQQLTISQGLKYAAVRAARYLAGKLWSEQVVAQLEIVARLPKMKTRLKEFLWGSGRYAELQVIVACQLCKRVARTANMR